MSKANVWGDTLRRLIRDAKKSHVAVAARQEVQPTTRESLKAKIDADVKDIVGDSYKVGDSWLDELGFGGRPLVRNGTPVYRYSVVIDFGRSQTSAKDAAALYDQAITSISGVAEVAKVKLVSRVNSHYTIPITPGKRPYWKIEFYLER